MVTIYDGPTNTSPVLGHFSGRTLPGMVTTTKPSALVRFQTNSSVTAPGWQISYNSVYPVYCSGTTTLTASEDTIYDGSGSNNYNNNTNCHWEIEPTGASCISVRFLNFSLDSLNGDYVKIIDRVSGLALATYKGKTIPKDQTYYTSHIMLMFYSNASVPGKGWTAYYCTTPWGVNDYSNIKAISIFPNPANSSLHVSFNMTTAKDVKLQLVNLTGQVVYENVQSGSSFVFNKNIDVTPLSKGVYTLRIISNGEIINKKVVIE